MLESGPSLSIIIVTTVHGLHTVRYTDIKSDRDNVVIQLVLRRSKNLISLSVLEVLISFIVKSSEGSGNHDISVRLNVLKTSTK